MLCMKINEIPAGKWATVRLQVGTDNVRIERIDAPRYDGDKARVVVTRFFVGGPRECRFAPRDVLTVFDPSERNLRIAAACEEELTCPAS